MAAVGVNHYHICKFQVDHIFPWVSNYILIAPPKTIFGGGQQFVRALFHSGSAHAQFFYYFKSPIQCQYCLKVLYYLNIFCGCDGGLHCHHPVGRPKIRLFLNLRNDLPPSWLHICLSKNITWIIFFSKIEQEFSYT